jgi:2-C-methyl-D-erythritol 4-phosphate cytidylyltransferase
VSDAIRAGVVVAAAGAGLRMGTGVTRKQYLELAGSPVLLRSLAAFLAHPSCRWVVAVLPPEDAADPPLSLPGDVALVPGGTTRSESVRAGLAALPAEADLVLVHDAARPLVTRAVVDRVLDAAALGSGAVPAVPVTDTLKRVRDDGLVVETVDRSALWAAQTPQGFPRRMLLHAYDAALREGWVATDDAALVERSGGRVVVVVGDPHNIKITRPEDLLLAETILASRRAS